MKRLTVILILYSVILSLSAQEDQTIRKAKLEFGIGINTLGPAMKMKNIMTKYNLDQDITNVLTETTTRYPRYAPLGGTILPIGGSIQISMAKYLNKQSAIGFLLNQSVSGAKGRDGRLFYLNVWFLNTSMIPFYRYEFNKNKELQVGPGLMLNSGIWTTSHSPIRVASTASNGSSYKLSPGVFIGLNLKKLSIQYLLTTREKMGPFKQSPNIYAAKTIPENKFGFSYLNFVYIFGKK